MSDARVTPDLRRWIAEQSALGHAPEALLSSMLASGWSAPSAERALSEVLLGLAMAFGYTGGDIESVGTHSALIEIDGSELLQMCADDPALDARLVILMERIAMMGMPANNSHYHDDALRAAHDLHRALLAKVRDARVKAVRS